jgi:hypothetical protein
LTLTEVGAAVLPDPMKPKTSRVCPAATVAFQPTSEPVKAVPLWSQSTFQALLTVVPAGKSQVTSQPLSGSSAVIATFAWKPLYQSLTTR